MSFGDGPGAGEEGAISRRTEVAVVVALGAGEKVEAVLGAGGGDI
jgi:hypothetical protein